MTRSPGLCCVSVGDVQRTFSSERTTHGAPQPETRLVNNPYTKQKELEKCCRTLIQYELHIWHSYCDIFFRFKTFKIMMCLWPMHETMKWSLLVAEIKGQVVLTLQNVNKLSPVAQVVLYTLLTTGEAVADSMNYAVQPCLTNKVRNSVKL